MLPFLHCALIHVHWSQSNYLKATPLDYDFPFHVRHLDFRQNGTVYLVGDGTIEKPTPENICVDTKIVFLSCRIAEIKPGVGPRVRNSIAPAVRGLTN